MFVVIGGGIAGVSCVETLAQESPDSEIRLISNSVLLKRAISVEKQGINIESFDVEEEDAGNLEKLFGNVKVILDTVTKLDTEQQLVYLTSHDPIKYDKLCICTGSAPKVIQQRSDYVIGIRDTDSIEKFAHRLSKATRVVVVGNGGIALELVYGVQNCEVIWAIKNKTVGTAFFDADAARFFMSSFGKAPDSEAPVRHISYEVKKGESSGALGSSLGPEWNKNLKLKGSCSNQEQLTIEYETEVLEILTREEFCEKVGLDQVEPWPVFVKLTNGKIYGCDLVVSATGVIPNTNFLNSCVQLSKDHGILVNRTMCSSVANVYAAGDVCTTNWVSKLWFQMRLWTQARQMGIYSAYCMLAKNDEDNVELYFPFEIFVHVTRFFGYKVILLGVYNAQNLGNDYEVIGRVVEQKEYIRLIVQNNIVQGALLIGETGLEETFENLIYNQIDIGDIKEGLLSKTADIEDYFD